MFEESKAWVFIFIISLLIGLGYTAHYFSSVDSANAALLESKSKLADMNQVLFQRKSDWEAVEKVSSKNREAMEKNTILLKAKDILDKRYRTIEGDLKYTVETMKTSVEKLRNTAPGTELGDITLTNGKVLRGAKVRKVEESGISMIHSDGIGLVSLDLLPADLKEKYDLGPDALVPVLINAQTSFLKKFEPFNLKTRPINKASSSTPTRLAAESPNAPTVDDEQIKKIKMRMAELDSRIDAAEKTAAQYQDTASKHQELAASAKSRGQPSTRHTLDANAASAQAAQLSQQSALMREERKKLDVELEYANKPK